jgi:hypothetical protein
MEIRRPVAALFVALALVGGGSALTGCAAAAGGLERNDGDVSDNQTANLGGNDPSSVSQGSVPDVSDRKGSDRNSNQDRDK